MAIFIHKNDGLFAFLDMDKGLAWETDNNNNNNIALIAHYYRVEYMQTARKCIFCIFNGIS